MPNFNEVCSAELINQRFMVPCDPVKYLDTDYGKNNWQEPKKNLSPISTKDKQKKGTKDTYHWPNLKYFGKYADDVFIRTNRWYKKSGLLNKELTYSVLSGGISSLRGAEGKKRIFEMCDLEDKNFTNNKI